MKSSIQRSRRALGGLSTALVCAVAACGDSSPSTVEAVGATDQPLGGYDYTDHRAWSQSPPGGLTATQMPMFVQIGFDDNPRSSLNTTPPSGIT